MNGLCCDLIHFSMFLTLSHDGQLKTIENQGELTESGHFLRAMLRGEEMPTNLPTPCPALTTPPPGQCSDSTDDCSETMCCNELGAKCFTSELATDGFYMVSIVFTHVLAHVFTRFRIVDLVNPFESCFTCLNWGFTVFSFVDVSSGFPYFGRAISSSWSIMLVKRKRRRGDRQVKNADMS